jgi:hypothetical protein
MVRTADEMVFFIVEEDVEAEPGAECPWLLRQLREVPVLGTPFTRNVPGHVLCELSTVDPDYLDAAVAFMVPEPVGYQVWFQESPQHVRLLVSVPQSGSGGGE